MPLRGFKEDALDLDKGAVCKIENGWMVVSLSCGHKVKALAPRAAWHAALMHARRCEPVNDHHPIKEAKR